MTTSRNLLLAVAVAVVLAVGSVALARGAGGNDDNAAAAPSAAGGTMLAPSGKIGEGGISVAEATDSTSPENLLVFGYLVEAPDGLRLCSSLLDSAEERCGAPSLAVEGSPGIEAGSVRTTVLGRVDGGRLVVVDLSTA